MEELEGPSRETISGGPTGGRPVVEEFERSSCNDVGDSGTTLVFCDLPVGNSMESLLLDRLFKLLISIFWTVLLERFCGIPLLRVFANDIFGELRYSETFFLASE